MHKALVIGNGESRAWFKPVGNVYLMILLLHGAVMQSIVMVHVHNLVAVDYGMQQEI